MSDPSEKFRDAVERIVWAYSNVDSADRAAVLRQLADALDAEEPPFDDIDEITRKTLKYMGYEFPRTGDESTSE